MRTPSVSPPAPPCPVQLVLEAVKLPGPVSNNNELAKEASASSGEYDQYLPPAEPDLLPRPLVTASLTHPASAPVLSHSEETVTIMPRSTSLNRSGLTTPGCWPSERRCCSGTRRRRSGRRQTLLTSHQLSRG